MLYAAPQGAPNPQGTVNFYSAAAIQSKLQTLVQQNGLEAFYSSNRIRELSQNISQINFAKLAERWQLPPQVRS